MNSLFPLAKTMAIADAPAGAVICFQRAGKRLFAIVTDKSTRESRSLVLLNSPFHDNATVVFVENWRDPESVVLVHSETRFELSLDQTKIDPNGSNSWDTPGALLLIGDQIYVQAYHDNAFGEFKLVNVQTGAVFSGRPKNFWSFLAWKIWVRDPICRQDTVLLEFDVGRSSA